MPRTAPLTDATLDALTAQLVQGDHEAACELKRAARRKSTSARHKTIIGALLEKYAPHEWKEQATLALRLDADHRFKGRWFHAANGEARDARTGGKLKKMGVKRGVPDVFIMVPVDGHPGVVIELKRLTDGVVSPEQETWANVLRACGFIVLVAYGWRDAWRQIGEIYA